MPLRSRFRRLVGSPLSRTISGRRGTTALLHQVAWFNRLRVGAALGVVCLTALSAHVLGIVTQPAPLYVLGVLIGIVDIAFILHFPGLADRARSSKKKVRRHVQLQIAIDLILLTALLHFSGGAANPFTLFFMLHVLIAALLGSVRGGVITALASFALVSSLALVERWGWLEHHSLGLGMMDVRTMAPAGLLLFLSVFGMTMGFSIYFVASLLSRLHRREREVMHLSGQLAHSEKLASIGTLAAGVSHEINNPIAVIRNKVQILRYRISDGDAPEVLHGELDTIEKHTRRVAAITEGLLTFARETPFELRSLEVERLVREAVDLVRVPFQAAGVRVHMVFSEPGPSVRGSQNHLLQVLVNLMLNARDASPRGGEVTVRTGQQEGMAIVAVEDEGAGIPEDVMDKIFDPFFTTKEVDRGTGLGLAVSHGIVERHSGHIEVESEPGKGATFSVHLPLADD